MPENPDEWMKQLNLLSEKLEGASGDELSSAINTIEKSTLAMVSWAQKGAYTGTKGQVQEKVQEVLGQIRSYLQTISTTGGKSGLTDRVSNIGNSLLECDKYLLRQRLNDIAGDHFRE
jgi:hypothetical protein